MNHGQELDLLVEISKLLKKYGADTFDRLARQLSSPDFVSRISGLLSAASKAAGAGTGTSRGAGHSASPSDFRTSLLALQETAPEKAAMLLDLYDNLMGKRVLPALADLKSFALVANIPVPASSTRPKVIVELVGNLQSLSLENLQIALAQLPPRIEKDDRSLENWTRIILDKELRPRKAN